MVLFLLDKCAACSKDLAFNAPRCVRCHVRYCDSTCQHDHWRRGHKQMCKKIHRGGNAEQYHADKKYKEAVAVAVEKCAAASGMPLQTLSELTVTTPPMMNTCGSSVGGVVSTSSEETYFAGSMGSAGQSIPPNSPVFLDK